MITALAGAATLVWGDVLLDEATAGGANCPPAPGDSNLTPVPRRELSTATPAKVAVRVRNSTSTRGLAARVAARLELFGFAEAAPPTTTPFTRPGRCAAGHKTRFGPDGA